MNSLAATLEANRQQIKQILPDRFKTFVTMDLTASNTYINPPTTENFELYQQKLLRQSRADFSVGRYNEKRTIYQTELFLAKEVRNIHLGIDINVPINTPIFAPLDGHVHSFANNQAPGDYGPTIILEHQLKEMHFYCLYGHLSLDSLSHIELGDKVNAGTILGYTGAPDINGGWPSHCHLQLIKAIGAYQGDYPGVCHADKACEFLDNSPDPSVFLSPYTQIND